MSSNLSLTAGPFNIRSANSKWPSMPGRGIPRFPCGPRKSTCRSGATQSLPRLGGLGKGSLAGLRGASRETAGLGLLAGVSLGTESFNGLGRSSFGIESLNGLDSVIPGTASVGGFALADRLKGSRATSCLVCSWRVTRFLFAVRRLRQSCFARVGLPAWTAFFFFFNSPSADSIKCRRKRPRSSRLSPVSNAH
jgi:hypothetical protein